MRYLIIGLFCLSPVSGYAQQAQVLKANAQVEAALRAHPHRAPRKQAEAALAAEHDWATAQRKADDDACKDKGSKGAETYFETSPTTGELLAKVRCQ